MSLWSIDDSGDSDDIDETFLEQDYLCSLVISLCFDDYLFQLINLIDFLI